MAKVDKPPRGTGQWANGARPLETDSLLAAGLTLVRHLDAHGKPCGDTVLASEDVPPEWLAVQEKPTRPCGACRSDLWRLDRVTGLSWLCGRCHL